MKDVTSGRLLKRRTFSAGLLAAPAVLSHIKVGRAADLRPLRVQQQQPIQSTDYLHILAGSVGIFAKHGIDATLVTAVNSIMPLLTGDCDIATIGSANGLVAIAKKQDLVFVSCSIPHAPSIMAYPVGSPLMQHAHKWPEAFTALRGKTLGVTVAGALYDQIGHWLASLAGMTPDKDITIRPAGDANLLLANLQKGTFDAALLPSPVFETALEKKLAVSALDFWKGEGPQELKDFPFATPAALRPFTEKNGPLLNDYIKAMEEAEAFAVDPANRDKVTAAIAKAVGVDPKSIASAMNTFVACCGSVKISRAQWASALSMCKINKVISEDYAYDKYIFEGVRA